MPAHGGMRPSLFRLLAPALLGCALPGAAEPPSAATILWPGGTEGPAVCVGKPQWFASVVPADVPIESLRGASVARPGGESAGRVLHLDQKERLCLLETESPLEGATPVPLDSATPLKPGQRAGCLSGSSSCRTTVAGKEWAYRGERFHLPLLRLRLSESGPDCRAGTPLVDDNGALVGLLTGRDTATEGEVFAIPASRVRKVVEDLKRHKRSGPVWVGLLFHEQSSTPEIVEVKNGSPAAKAGFEPGDVVLKLNGREIDSLAELVEQIHNLSVGETARFRVLRGVEKLGIPVTPGFSEVAGMPR